MLPGTPERKFARPNLDAEQRVERTVVRDRCTTCFSSHFLRMIRIAECVPTRYRAIVLLRNVGIMLHGSKFPNILRYHVLLYHSEIKSRYKKKVAKKKNAIFRFLN